MTDRSLQSEARRLEVLTLVAYTVVIVGLVVRSLLLPLLDALRETAPGSWEFWNAFGPDLIDALPAFVLLGAVDASKTLFGRLAKGEMFGDAVGRGVKGIGSSLVFAAVAISVIVPWLQAWVDGRYGFGGIHLDPMILVLGVVGAAMLMLGRLLKRAGSLQAELDRFV